MLKIKYLFIFALLLGGLQASTMYTLSGVKAVYPVIEIGGKSVPKSYKKEISTMINEVLDDLHIKHDGYNQRALALIIKEMPIDDNRLITVRLGIGEQVYRIGSKAKSFAMTYQNSEQILLRKGGDIEDRLEDTLSLLLDKFSEQYLEEQKKIKVIKEKNGDFASTVGYMTDYDKAMKKAKKFHKPVMLVLVANYCPWCRKFENRVLLKEDVNKMVKADYIPVILNKEKDRFPKRFNKNFTPIVHFIDSKSEKAFKSIAGYNNKDEFLYILKKYHTKK